MEEEDKSGVFPPIGPTARWAQALGAFRTARIWSRPPRGTLDGLLARAVEACGGSSGSVFLLEPGGQWLRDALGIWDWTRTSFRVWLEHWPNVASALARDRAIQLGPQLAEGAEADWFDRGGIQSCIAAPMVGQSGPVGVLFVDFAGEQRGDLAPSLELARRTAKSWAHAIEAAGDSAPRARGERVG